jgi:hypothetical protein
MPEDSVDIKPSYIFRSDGLIVRKRDGLLVKTVYYDKNYIITFLTGGHGLEIHNNVLLRMIGNGQRFKKSGNLIIKNISSVARIIILDIPFDVC